jgi:hypothetical protein
VSVCVCVCVSVCVGVCWGEGWTKDSLLCWGADLVLLQEVDVVW